MDEIKFESAESTENVDESPTLKETESRWENLKQSRFLPLLVSAGILTVVVALVVFGVSQKAIESVQTDRNDLLTESLAQQAAPLRRLVQLRLLQDRARLAQFAAQRSVMGPGRARGFGEFAAIALVVPASGGQWNITWIERGPLASVFQSESLSIPDGREIALIKSLPLGKVASGDISWQRLADEKGRPLWSLSVGVETVEVSNPATQAANPGLSALPEGTDYQSVARGSGEKAVVVGLYSKNPLATYTEDYIGTPTTAFVIDSRGYAATHSDKNMIGAQLKEDSTLANLATEVLSQGRSSAQVQIPGNQILASYEQVEHSNLTVALALNQAAAKTASAAALMARPGVLFAAFGALAVGLLLTLIWGSYLIPRTPLLNWRPKSLNREETESEELFASTREVEPPVLAQVKAEFAHVETKKIVAEVDREAIIADLGQRIETVVREPILTSFAHLRLAQAKARELLGSGQEGQELEQNLLQLEEELRRVRSTVESVAQSQDILIEKKTTEPAPLIAEESLQKQDPIDLYSALRAAANGFRDEWIDQGIRFELLEDEALKSRGARANTGRVEKIVSEIFKNATRSLLGRPFRRIECSLRYLENQNRIRLLIADTGTGMDREVLATAFEPFSKAFATPEALGLGLGKARELIQADQGEIKIESAPGSGTRVILEWPSAILPEAPLSLIAEEKVEPVLEKISLSDFDIADDEEFEELSLGSSLTVRVRPAARSPLAP